MGKSYISQGAFGPDDLGKFAGVYQDVCRRVEKMGTFPLTAQGRDTIAVAIFNLAGQGIRDPEVLWCRALSEVVTFHEVQTSLDRIVKQASSASSSQSRT